MLLALTREPLSQSQISSQLNVSKSLISGTISELLGFGLVHAASTHRNAPYESTMDIWPIISKVLRDREWLLLETSRLALEAAIEEVEFIIEDGVEVPYDLSKMNLMLKMTKLAQRFLKMFVRARMPQSSEKFSDWAEGASGFLKTIGKLYPQND
jgi:DNA-binding transcriptional regulator GbsR (MarR family)